MADMEATVDTTIDTVETNTAPDGAENTQEVTETAEQTSEVGKDAESEGEATEVNTDAASAVDEGLVFTPVYNGAVNPIKASDTERVTTLLQKGMKFEHMADDLEKLHQLTAAYGAKNSTEMLDMMLKARESAEKAEYIRKYGQEAGEKLFEIERAKRAEKHGTFKDAEAAADKASRDAINERLAVELVELQAERPEVLSIEDVPRSVVDMALQKGIPLLDAYNRYALKEQKRAGAAAQQQAANQKAATGSLANGGDEASDPVWEAFLRGSAKASNR